MATTPPPPPNNSPLNDLNDQQSALFNITEQYKKINKEAGIYNFETRSAVSRTTELNRLIEATKDVVTDIGVAYVKQSKVDLLTIKLKKEIAKLTEQQKNDIKHQTVEQGAQYKQLQQSLDIQKKIKTQLETANLKELEAKRKQELSEENLIMFQRIGNGNALTQIRLENIAIGRAKVSEDMEKKRLELEQKLTAEQGRSAKISSSSYITNKNLTDQQLESAQAVLQTLTSQAKAIEEGNRKLQRGNFLREILRRIPGLSAFADLPKHAEMFGLALSGTLIVVTAIVVAIKEIVGAIFKVDNEITDIAKNLGISKAGATVLRDQFVSIAKTTGATSDNLSSLYITATNLVGAMSELNDSFGTAVVFSAEQLKDQVEMTKVMGISVEAASQLQKLSELTGQSSKQTRLDIEQQVINLSKETGIRLNARKVIEQVAKIEGQLAVQYKNNPTLIAKAVVQAQRFGLTLQEAKKSADSLLNFETSIDAQLEAQLLTDKALNFENARELALRGDSAGAAAELLKQVGSLTEYQKLNVIQQESLAKSIGMSADELSNTLRYQTLLTKLSSEQRKNLDDVLSKYKGTSQYAEKLQEIQAATNADELDHNLKQVSIQAQFEASMSKLKDAFASIVTDKFINALKFIADEFVSIAGWLGAGSGNPTPMHDGMISPHGNIVISTPQGAIVPDRNDSLIATTNPGGLLGGGGSDMSAVANKLDKLIDLISQGGNVYMDSKKVGTTQALSYSSYK